jgi:predicted DNA-binding transcriptional regulator AlpA
MSYETTRRDTMRLLTIEDLAERYQVQTRTINNWLKRNPKFPRPIRFSRRHLRWREKDLERFEASE